MPTVFGGIKPGFGPVLKIMKDNGDDPLTTPNNQFEKFFFNSETTEIGYVEDIEVKGYEPAYTSGTETYLPAGSNRNTCQKAVKIFGATQQWYYCDSYWGLDYYPIVEVRRASGANFNVFAGPGTYYGDSSGGWFPTSTSTSLNTGGGCGILCCPGQLGAEPEFSATRVCPRMDRARTW